MDELGIEEARSTLGYVMDRARFQGIPTRITRHGKAVAVVVPVAWYEATRKLADDRVIHHIDGDATNNDPANLELIDPKENL
jgi:prevent-host-death family protein